MNDDRLDDLRRRVDEALADLQSIRDADAAATHAVHVVRQTEQTLQRHTLPLFDDVRADPSTRSARSA